MLVCSDTFLLLPNNISLYGMYMYDDIIYSSGFEHMGCFNF